MFSWDLAILKFNVTAALAVKKEAGGTRQKLKSPRLDIFSR